jgi:hypothetical protein
MADRSCHVESRGDTDRVRYEAEYARHDLPLEHMRGSSGKLHVPERVSR